MDTRGTPVEHRTERGGDRERFDDEISSAFKNARMIQRKDPTDENAASGERLRYVERNDTVPTCTAVIEAVAAVSDRDATDLPPLYESIDPDALNMLFDPVDDHSDRPLAVSFTYFGYRVRVDRDAVEVWSLETN
jgi:hypothetical protein